MISDEEHIKFMTTTSQTLGGIEKEMKGLSGYIKSVSENHRLTVGKLEAHEQDINANGWSSRREVWGIIGRAIVTAGAVATVIMVILKITGHG